MAKELWISELINGLYGFKFILKTDLELGNVIWFFFGDTRVLERY